MCYISAAADTFTRVENGTSMEDSGIWPGFYVFIHLPLLSAALYLATSNVPASVFSYSVSL